jgi:hypothetical protein
MRQRSRRLEFRCSDCLIVTAKAETGSGDALVSIEATGGVEIVRLTLVVRGVRQFQSLDDSWKTEEVLLLLLEVLLLVEGPVLISNVPGELNICWFNCSF